MQNENVNENESLDNNEYIETIKKMKETMVDKEAYEKLKAENKQLLDTVINGGDVPPTEAEQEVDIDSLRDDLFNHENNNLEYASKSLQLRNELMKRGYPDPFLPIGSQISPTDEDISKANHVAEVLQECIDYAEGDSAVFTNELQRRTVDVKIR